jgi:hypothetical protein
MATRILADQYGYIEIIGDTRLFSLRAVVTKQELRDWNWAGHRSCLAEKFRKLRRSSDYIPGSYVLVKWEDDSSYLEEGMFMCRTGYWLKKGSFKIVRK